MADSPEKFERVQQPAEQGESLLNRVENPATTGTSTKDVSQDAQSKMDKRMDDTKLNLSVNEMQSVKEIEKAILKGDPIALEKELGKFALDPKAAEGVMETVSADLKEIGIDGRWSYSTHRNEPGKGYYMRGQEDEGHFTLAKDDGNGTFTAVKFSTLGPPEGINQPIPAADGSHSPRNPSPVHPGVGLVAIRDEGLMKVASK